MAKKITAKDKFIVSTLKAVADYLDEIKKKEPDEKITWEDAVKSIRDLSKTFIL